MTNIDKSDKAFDKLTLAADFGETLEAGTILYEAMAAIELLETTPAEKFWDMHFLGNGRLSIY